MVSPVRRVTAKDLELAQKNGAKITRPPMSVEIPGLEKAMEHLHAMKHERQKSHEALTEKKLAKMDEVIKAIGAIKPGKDTDLSPLMKMMQKILKEHATIVAEFNAHKKHCDLEDEEHEQVAYKLTGKRDRRGLIDLEHGLMFTPVNGKGDE